MLERSSGHRQVVLRNLIKRTQAPGGPAKPSSKKVEVEVEVESRAFGWEGCSNPEGYLYGY